MKPALVEQAHRLAHRRSGTVSVLFEVAAQRGIPDAVVADFSPSRDDVPAVTDASDLAAWIALTAARGRFPSDAVGARDLGAWCSLSAGYLGSVCLPRLRTLGLVSSPTRGRWALDVPFVDRARTLVTVELKRNDWRGGIRQAYTQGLGSDRAWLVLDGSGFHEGRPKLATSITAARARGVGLSTLHPDATLKIHEPAAKGGPPASRKLDQQLARAILSERAWDLLSRGLASGPLFPVFGRPAAAAS